VLFEKRNRLRTSVLGNQKVFLAESLYRLAATIENHHIDLNRARLRLEGDDRRLALPGNTLSMEWKYAEKKSELNQARAQVHRTHLTG
jgi:hypothetical protein